MQKDTTGQDGEAVRGDPQAPLDPVRRQLAVGLFALFGLALHFLMVIAWPLLSEVRNALVNSAPVSWAACSEEMTAELQSDNSNMGMGRVADMFATHRNEVYKRDFSYTSNVSYRRATSVDVFDFRATRPRKGKKVPVEWRTAQEVGIPGSHVYRPVDGKAVRVTETGIGARTLEPTFGPTVGGGHKYGRVDTPPNRHSVYILENPGLENNPRRHGPIPVTDR